MEEEKILTGYCRTLDQSRMVTVELENGTIVDVDCLYGNCVHEPNCPIARKIREITDSPAP